MTDPPPSSTPSGNLKARGPASFSPRGGWWTRHRAHVVGRVFLVGALMGTGVIAGWVLASDRSLVEVEPSASSAPTSDEAVNPQARVMPDLRGLGERDARQVLADLGVQVDAVRTEVQPSAGESGLVVSQDPVYGYDISQDVVLQVSRPAKVPEFEGRPADEVLADLDELGAEAATVSRYTPAVSPGQVASIDPAPGTVLPVAVTVVISAEPDSVPLSEVDATVGGCYTGTDTMNGSAFQDLLQCESSEEPTDLVWIIRRAGTLLTGVVGIPDSQDESASMELIVYGDQRALGTFRVGYGEPPQRINLDLSGVLRLELRYRSLTEEYGSLGLGRLELFGDAAALHRLERS